MGWRFRGLGGCGRVLWPPRAGFSWSGGSVPPPVHPSCHRPLAPPPSRVHTPHPLIPSRLMWGCFCCTGCGG
eukprot:8581830-Alexandrium_andersonii.AAC.1